jgi:hypothetical protein
MRWLTNNHIWRGRWWSSQGHGGCLGSGSRQQIPLGLPRLRLRGCDDGHVARVITTVVIGFSAPRSSGAAWCGAGDPFVLVRLFCGWTGNGEVCSGTSRARLTLPR